MVSNSKRRLPPWLKAKAPGHPNYIALKNLLADLQLNTVCESAQCPNIGECWSQRTATFMILGDVCTRSCGFCAIKTGRPQWLDEGEPERVAAAIARLGLEHAVITSVNRDELPDGGARIFARTIAAVHHLCPETSVEVLIPDFKGDWQALATVLEASPDILNHNIETPPRLYPTMRPQAQYDRSLELLDRARKMSPAPHQVRHDARGWRDQKRNSPEHPRPSRCRLRHSNLGPIPKPVRPPRACRAIRPPRRIRGVAELCPRLGL